MSRPLTPRAARAQGLQGRIGPGGQGLAAFAQIELLPKPQRIYAAVIGLMVESL